MECKTCHQRVGVKYVSNNSNKPQSIAFTLKRRTIQDQFNWVWRAELLKSSKDKIGQLIVREQSEFRHVDNSKRKFCELLLRLLAKDGLLTYSNDKFEHLINSRCPIHYNSLDLSRLMNAKNWTDWDLKIFEIIAQELNIKTARLTARSHSLLLYLVPSLFYRIRSKFFDFKANFKTVQDYETGLKDINYKLAKILYCPEWLRNSSMIDLKHRLCLSLRLPKIENENENGSLPLDELYLARNNYKCFISIDIKSANFNMIKLLDPTYFCSYDTWGAFMASVLPPGTPTFFLESKLIRQAALGKVSPMRIKRLERFFLRIIWTRLKEFILNDSELGPLVDVRKAFVFSCDELLLEVKEANVKLVYSGINNIIAKNAFFRKPKRLREMLEVNAFKLYSREYSPKMQIQHEDHINNRPDFEPRKKIRNKYEDQDGLSDSESEEIERKPDSTFFVRYDLIGSPPEWTIKHFPSAYFFNSLFEILGTEFKSMEDPRDLLETGDIDDS